MSFSSRLFTLARDLEPDPTELDGQVARALRLVRELHEGPAWMFSVQDAWSHGSHPRRTAIRGRSDVDVVVELRRAALVTMRGEQRSARDTLSRMAGEIRRRRAGLWVTGTLDVRVQSHSVGVVYPVSGVSIDIVPALRDAHGLKIPEPGSGEWIRIHADATAAALDGSVGLSNATRPAIRLLKGWKAARGRYAPISSFAIETWVVGAVRGGVRGLPELIDAWFQGLAGHHKGHRWVQGRDDGSPMVLEDPVSGRNLLVNRTAAERKLLVETARRGADAFEAIRERHARGARVDQALARLFLPTELR